MEVFAEVSRELTQVPVVQGFQPKISLIDDSQPYSTDCQIDARNDLEAVSCWLKKHANNLKTFDAYRREAERLLMWCVLERGLTLGKLKAQDFEIYLQFIQEPPKTWCADRKDLRAGKHSSLWRPFVAGLKGTSFKMALRIVHSLMNYLVAADYIRANPLKLIDTKEKKSIHGEERKQQIWQRMLEDDEWDAVQQVLENLPETSEIEIDKKLKTQLLFAMLYFLALRIEEVVKHNTWGSFKYRDGKWWFAVRGKGDKFSEIPVHNKLLSFVKVYRLHLGKLPLPSPEEDEPFFISKLTGNPLGLRQLFNWVKFVAMEASKQFVKAPLKQKKLQKLSPHWMRHLCASHLDSLGVTDTVSKEIMRHSSIHTTQLYQHAGDNLRHQEVQKIDMWVRPRIIEEATKPSPQMSIEIFLSGGSLNRLISLEKLIIAIEQNALQSYDWQWRGSSKFQFLEKLKKEMLYLKEIRFGYTMENLDEDQINAIKAQIKLESDIRLFVCKVEVDMYVS